MFFENSKYEKEKPKKVKHAFAINSADTVKGSAVSGSTKPRAEQSHYIKEKYDKLKSKQQIF
jgi:hypothetical protein